MSLEDSLDRLEAAIDALIALNRLNAGGAGRLYGSATSQPYLDVNMDGFLSLDPVSSQ